MVLSIRKGACGWEPAISGFPEGMTERKARAKANTGVSPLRCASVEMTAFESGIRKKRIPGGNDRKEGEGKGRKQRGMLIWGGRRWMAQRRGGLVRLKGIGVGHGARAMGGCSCAAALVV